MDKDDLFTIETDPLFDLAQQPERTSRKSGQKRWHRHYVQFPWVWVERLQAVRSGSTYRLALLLVYEHWRTGGQPIVLSNVLATAEGLPRRTKWRALTELEDLGLLQVERQRRKAPRVILQHLTRS
jgi:hypothetical protein